MKTLEVNINRDIGNFSLNIKAKFDLSEYNIILGPSGSGKTLTLRYIAGLEQKNSSITLNGNNISHLPPQKREIIFIPQGNTLFPHLTVKENILFGIKYGNNHSAFQFEEIVKIFQIDYLLQRYPQTLSAGEKQRVTLARAIILKPGILLLDEPLSSLDFHIKLELIEFLKNLKEKFHISFIHVTHDPVEAILLADKITILEKGEVKFQGKWKELEKAPSTPFIQKIRSFKKII